MVRLNLEKRNLTPREEREARRRQALRQAIIQAAERLLIKLGYAALTMDDVAREAEISKATLYHYFRSKGDLVLELFVYYFEKFYRNIVRIRSEAKSATEKLKEVITYFLRVSREKETISRVLMVDRIFLKKMRILAGKTSCSKREEDLVAEIKKQREKIIEEASRIIEEGIARGEFRSIDRLLATRLIEALLQGFIHSRFWNPSRLPIEKETEILLEFILLGIGKKKEEVKGACP